MILVQNIIIHSTDSVTEYSDPKTFIDNLPNYMKIESQLPEGLGMISIGQDAPDQQYQDIPWLQLDENNNPIALKYYNGVEWVETRPYRAIQAPYEGLYVQYGQVTYTHVQNAPDTWISSETLAQNDGSIGKFLFPELFKSKTYLSIQLTPVFSNIHRADGGSDITKGANDDEWKTNIDAMVDAFKGFEWALDPNFDTTGFAIRAKTLDAVPAGMSVTFNWMAMGEKV